MPHETTSSLNTGLLIHYGGSNEEVGENYINKSFITVLFAKYH
jgi:hypothetical protein